MSNFIVTQSQEIEKLYFNPILYLNYDQYDGAFQNIFLYIAKSILLSNTTQLDKSEKNIKNIHKNIIAIKKVNVSDICPVIERIDWKSNTYYDIYTDDQDMFNRDENNKLIKKFYIKNKFDQIFKCLWNNENNSNTYSITNITTANNYKSIEHSGGTFSIGSYVTINETSPTDFKGTYIVISSGLGIANVAYGNSGSYIITSNSNYISGGTIKYAELATDEPLFDVGSFDKNNIVKTSDGYKWKYIYTINPDLKMNFYDNNWIPVPIQIDNQNPNLTTYKSGCIDVVNVYNGGSNYTDGTGTVNLFITGDGTGATGDVYVENGKISDIILSDYGSNYTYANVSVVPSFGYSGSGAELKFSISPVGGHGFNIVREFDCKNIILSSTIEKTDNLPTDITYYQIGMMYNPYTYENVLATNTFYNTMTIIIVSAGINNYEQDEKIYQGSSLEDSTFSGDVVSFDNINNILYVINITGTPQQNYALIGVNSSANRIVTQINTPEIIPYSGKIYYMDDSLEIQRHPLGSEQIRILFSY